MKLSKKVKLLLLKQIKVVPHQILVKKQIKSIQLPIKTIMKLHPQKIKRSMFWLLNLMNSRSIKYSHQKTMYRINKEEHHLELILSQRWKHAIGLRKTKTLLQRVGAGKLTVESAHLNRVLINNSFPTQLRASSLIQHKHL